MWDLAMSASVHIYNRSPHKSIDYNIPLKRFAPHIKCHFEQIKRFGCLSYMKIQRQAETKFSPRGMRTFLVGYTHTGYQLFHPETGKFFESRNVRFNEKYVLRDRAKIDDIANWPRVPNEQQKDETWLNNFLDSNDEIGGNENCERSTQETLVKRLRGRPKKHKLDNNDHQTNNDEETDHSQ